MEHIVNPHDKIFREIWSDQEAARNFLESYLPAAILQHIAILNHSCHNIANSRLPQRRLCASESTIHIGLLYRP